MDTLLKAFWLIAVVAVVMFIVLFIKSKNKGGGKTASPQKPKGQSQSSKPPAPRTPSGPQT